MRELYILLDFNSAGDKIHHEYTASNTSDWIFNWEWGLGQDDYTKNHVSYLCDYFVALGDVVSTFVKQCCHCVTADIIEFFPTII